PPPARPNARANRPFFLDVEAPLLDAPLLFLIPKNQIAWSLGLGFRDSVGGMLPGSRFGLDIGGSVHVDLRDSPKLRDYHLDLVIRKNETVSITNVDIGLGVKTL